MNNKRIVFTEANHAELLDCSVPNPGKGQARIRLCYSAISSGTERANLVGELNISAKEILSEVKFPKYLGYSSAGIIDAVGEGVTEYKVGDRVALSWSTHSLYQCLSVNNIYKLPDDIDLRDAALLHIACFPLAAIRKCHLEIGESAIVMGLGILGLFAVSLLRAAGASPVIAVDPIAEKRRKALDFGADYALDPYAPDFAETARKLCAGGANVAIEVTGVGAGLDGVLDCMAPMGRVALLGCTRHSDFCIDYYHKVHGPGISLIGAHTNARPKSDSSSGLWSLRDDMSSLMRLTQGNRIRFADMVDEIHTPAEATHVYNRLATEKAFPIVLFDWSELS